MSSRDPQTLEALARQADTLTGLFRTAGYTLISPGILQPADIFLDRYGEEIRARTYVFTDPGGAELCLRPDLTIPVCRHHLERDPPPAGEARYCYDGPAFRFQPGGPNGGRPREFGQIGIEFFGGGDAGAADTEVMRLAVEAVDTAGLEDYAIHLGDLGIFAAFVDGVEMPERWRERLRQRFWRPRAFRALLARLAGHGPGAVSETHRGPVAGLGGLDAEQAAGAVDRLLGELDIPLVGGRGVDEIAGRLLERTRDAEEEPLSEDVVTLISAYLATEGPPRQVVESIARLSGAAAVSRVLTDFSHRLDLIEERGIDLARCFFSAEFGRNLEYYTGFVFQIEVPGRGVAGQVAGGGRYDNLLADLGAGRPVPAVGLAIHSERLLAAARGTAI